jgi:hypothetical protein
MSTQGQILKKKREFVNMVFDGNLYYQEGTIEHLQWICFLIMPVKWRKRDVLYKKEGKPCGNPSQGDEGFEPRPLGVNEVSNQLS